MNSVLIVLPILTLLMFDLGLALRPKDFLLVARRPRAVAVGLAGQLVLLPVLAFVLGAAFRLPPLLHLGLVLVACCPGGSSSNVFSMLAHGDVALSVSLTALSSVITLVTVPAVMAWTTMHVGAAVGVRLPLGGMMLQNLLTMLLPIVLGILVRRRWPAATRRLQDVLNRCAFPALMLLAGLFFVQHRATIAARLPQLGACTALLILVAAAAAWLAARACRLDSRERRTIVIEVGMQNAAQAIALASSPFIFNNGIIAIPAIIYALLMNVVLLTYVAAIGLSERRR